MSISRVARSIADALVDPKTVKQLALLSAVGRPRQDIRCSNLLCDKIGKPCICRLSSVLGRTTTLKSLLLAGNGLDDLPDSLWGLQELEVLDLQDNQLTNLSSRISELRSLRVLKIRGNPELKIAMQDIASMRFVRVVT